MGIVEIIAEVHIAKGTYYYFPSMETTLEAVIDRMISQEVQRAQVVSEWIAQGAPGLRRRSLPKFCQNQRKSPCRLWQFVLIFYQLEV